MLKLGWRRWHPVIREWLTIAAVLSVGMVLAIEQGWFYRIDQTLYDQSISLWARPADRDIVIVGIDEDSLKQLGRWPLRRGIDATLVNALSEAGAKVIVMDVILTEADNRDPAGDAALAAALRASPRIVLPVIQQVSDGVPVGESMPAAAFADAARHVGHTHARIDADGILRSAFLYAGFGAPRHDLLSVAGWTLAEPERVAQWRQRHPQPVEEAAGASASSAPPAWIIQDPYLIPFAGPPGHFTTVSAIDVLRKDVPLSMFAGKIVLLGSTASGSGDEYPTPVSGLTRAMPGVEIHANVLQGLRQGIDLQLAAPWAAALASWLVLMLLLAAFVRLSPRRALMLTVALCISVVIASALLFRLGQLWMSPVPLVLTMMIAYPVWSWRKLEATQRYLDAELVRLQNEQTLLPQPARKQGGHGSPLSDVIERRIAAVQEAGQLLRDLNRFVADSLESLPEAAIVTDAAGKIRLVNSSAARLFAGSGDGKQAALIGSDLLPLLADFKQANPRPWAELLTDVAETAKVTSLEVKAPDDSEYLLQIAPSFTHAGARAGTIITLTDISPLRESERRRDEALRFLSHDMRSPQASILTLLEMQAAAPEMMSTATLLERIGKYSRRTLNLADDFLRLAKAERSRAQDFSVVALDEVLQDAVEEAWSLASSKQIRIDIVGDAELPLVNGDRDLLTRALINLLSNAIKYSPADTVIQCSVNSVDSVDTGNGAPKEWRVDVADQGFGITPDGLSKLFTRFVRLHTEQQPEVDGIGLGLVFVKTVVEKHGGSIAVQSKVAAQPGDPHGTTFSLTLPALPPADAD